MAVTELALLQFPPTILNPSSSSPLPSKSITEDVTNNNNDNDSDGPLHSLPPALQTSLTKALKTLTSSSSHNFTFYRSLTNPSQMYIVGSWESVEYHRDVFLSSEANQALLDDLVRDWKVGVQWMFHLDVDPRAREGVERFASGDDGDGVGNEKEVEKKKKEKNKKGVIRIVRVVVSTAKDGGRGQDLVHGRIGEIVKKALDDDDVDDDDCHEDGRDVMGTQSVGGWRVDGKENIGVDIFPSSSSSGQGSNDSGDNNKGPAVESKQNEEFVLFTAWDDIERSGLLKEHASPSSAMLAQQKKALMTKLGTDVEVVGVDVSYAVKMDLDSAKQ